MRLSMKAHAAAAEFLKSHARPLEAAIYAYLFEDASAEPAIFALAAYQNADGGFGNALEPDLRLPDSSVIATTIAFQHFRTLALPGDHPMLTAAAQWLKSQYISDEKRWRIIPANIDDAPHAPWWQPDGGLSNSRVNPTAEILGDLYEYPTHFDAAMRDELTAQLAAYLDAQDDIMEMHDLLCYVALIENSGVPETVKLKFLPKLKRVADKSIERSPEKWPEYTIPPLAIINTPASPFIELFKNELPQNFEFMLAGQSEDGAWRPNWQWAEDPKLAAQVEREWAGIQTLNNLQKLRAFGMIAGLKA